MGYRNKVTKLKPSSSTILPFVHEILIVVGEGFFSRFSLQGKKGMVIRFYGAHQ